MYGQDHGGLTRTNGLCILHYATNTTIKYNYELIVRQHTLQNTQQVQKLRSLRYYRLKMSEPRQLTIKNQTQNFQRRPTADIPSLRQITNPCKHFISRDQIPYLIQSQLIREYQDNLTIKYYEPLIMKPSNISKNKLHKTNYKIYLISFDHVVIEIPKSVISKFFRNWVIIITFLDIMRGTQFQNVTFLRCFRAELQQNSKISISKISLHLTLQHIS